MEKRRAIQNLRTKRWRSTLVGLAAAGIVVALVLASNATALSNRQTSRPAATKSFSCSVGTQPEQPAYDPVNHYIYVPNSGSGNVTVVRPPCTVVATITLPSGSAPTGAVFNSLNNHVYVTDMSLNQVYVISGTTVLSTIVKSAFHCPVFPAFDPGANVIAIPNGCGHTVTFLTSTDRALSVPVGKGPGAVGYDPHFATLLVANVLSGNVTVLNAITLAHITDVTLGLGYYPNGVVYNPVCACDFVSDNGLSIVTALSGNGTIIGSINVGLAPSQMAWSQKSLDVYVANYASNNISVIHGTSVVRTIPGGDQPDGAVYCDFNGMVYVTYHGIARLFAYS